MNSLQSEPFSNPSQSSLSSRGNETSVDGAQNVATAKGLGRLKTTFKKSAKRLSSVLKHQMSRATEINNKAYLKELERDVTTLQHRQIRGRDKKGKLEKLHATGSDFESTSAASTAATKNIRRAIEERTGKSYTGEEVRNCYPKIRVWLVDSSKKCGSFNSDQQTNFKNALDDAPRAIVECGNFLKLRPKEALTRFIRELAEADECARGRDKQVYYALLSADSKGIFLQDRALFLPMRGTELRKELTSALTLSIDKLYPTPNTYEQLETQLLERLKNLELGCGKGEELEDEVCVHEQVVQAVLPELAQFLGYEKEIHPASSNLDILLYQFRLGSSLTELTKQYGVTQIMNALREMPVLDVLNHPDACQILTRYGSVICKDINPESATAILPSLTYEDPAELLRAIIPHLSEEIILAPLNTDGETLPKWLVNSDDLTRMDRVLAASPVLSKHMDLLVTEALKNNKWDAVASLVKRGAVELKSVWNDAREQSLKSLQRLFNLVLEADSLVNLSELDLRELSIEQMDLTKVFLGGCRLSADQVLQLMARPRSEDQVLKLDDVRLESECFDEIDFSGVSMCRSTLVAVAFNNCDLVNLDLEGCRVDEFCSFRKSQLAENRIGQLLKNYPAQGPRLNLEEANLAFSILDGLDLKAANFSRTFLYEVSFDGANTTGVDFSGTQLSREQAISIIASAKQLDRGANFDYVDFSDQDLSHVDFGRAQLIGTNFSNSILDGARMDRAHLHENSIVGASVKGLMLGDKPTSFVSLNRTQLIDLFLTPIHVVPDFIQRTMAFIKIELVKPSEPPSQPSVLQGTNLSGEDLSDLDLRRLRFHDCSLIGINWNNTYLSNGAVAGSLLDKPALVAFTRCARSSVVRFDLTGARLHHSIDYVGLSFHRAILCDVEFGAYDSDEESMPSRKERIPNVTKAQLSGADISGVSGLGFLTRARLLLRENR